MKLEIIMRLEWQ